MISHDGFRDFGDVVLSRSKMGNSANAHGQPLLIINKARMRQATTILPIYISSQLSLSILPSSSILTLDPIHTNIYLEFEICVVVAFLAPNAKSS